MLYKRRHGFRKYEEKLGKSLAKLGLSPNHWTLISLVLAFLAAYLIIGQNFIGAGVVLIISAFLDVVDGSVARATGKSSKKGAYLDTIVDRYVEFLIVFAMFFVPLPALFFPAHVWLFLYLFGGLMTTYAKSAAKEKELVKSELKGGLLERAERMMLLFVGVVLATLSTLILVYVIALLAVLANVSALQRIKKGFRN